MGAILTEGIGIMTAGIVPYAEALGGGLVSLANSLFVDSTGDTEALGIVGGIAFLFAGVGLAVGLSRWFLNWITSLGARNS